VKRAPVGQQDYDVTIRSQDLGTRQHISVMRMGKSGVDVLPDSPPIRR
jgi:hypothetical protein